VNPGATGTLWTRVESRLERLGPARERPEHGRLDGQEERPALEARPAPSLRLVGPDRAMLSASIMNDSA
jgi:hypothetical protein